VSGHKSPEQLLNEADERSFTGWDFSYLAGRMLEEPPPWNYEARARQLLAAAGRVVDLGTGGGEVFARLAPLPRVAAATEVYPPNAVVAARRLEPLGAQVVLVAGAPENYLTLNDPLADRPHLPFRAGAFDLVIDRHESYLAAEVRRILQAGGRFLTQQCGGLNCVELNDLIGIPRPGYAHGGWNLAGASRQLEAVGFEVLDAREDFGAMRFRDAAAVAYFLKALPWQAPDFSVAKFRERLLELQSRIERQGPLSVPTHHFIIEAVKPL
jgi:SAM-dependent methyltransferase